MEVLWLKLIALVVIFTIATGFAVLPLVFKRLPVAKRDLVLSLANAFAGGVFFATGFLHLLGEALEEFTAFVDWNPNLLALLTVSFGFCFTFWIEKVLFIPSLPSSSSSSLDEEHHAHHSHSIHPQIHSHPLHVHHDHSSLPNSFQPSSPSRFLSDPSHHSHHSHHSHRRSSNDIKLIHHSDHHHHHHHRHNSSGQPDDYNMHDRHPIDAVDSEDAGLVSPSATMDGPPYGTFGSVQHKSGEHDLSSENVDMPPVFQEFEKISSLNISLLEHNADADLAHQIDHDGFHNHTHESNEHHHSEDSHHSSHGHGHGHDHSEHVVALSSDNVSIFAYVLVIILSFHSIIAGLVLGLTNNFSEALTICIALFSHQWTESFALGVSLINQRVSRAKFF